MCPVRAPSGLSHPLDAFFLTKRSEFVSPRFRSWGLPFKVFLLIRRSYALSSAATLVTFYHHSANTVFGRVFRV
jgi:hypothetical protein